MVATRSQLPTRLLQAAGGRGLLAALGSRLAHSAAASSSTAVSSGGMEEEGKQAHPAVPSSLPEVPPRWRPSPQQQLSLASINDPEAWGLASAPAPYEQQQPGEAAGYFWLGSSLSNPKEPSAAQTRPSSPQGFRTGMAGQAPQRKIAFRSSMIEPELPFSFRSSMTDPPLCS
ncbi:hypothetical protein COHA_003701 [Chlorella ohadii]|uniref:Uncharacterized protein n=1 Tax=Chlorella ohadii TaxID=2649997 RepID=A0AAD5DQW5_9CHLO|nr:hypothetical protein COHA_003701 [Chlorella ohadii]